MLFLKSTFASKILVSGVHMHNFVLFFIGVNHIELNRTRNGGFTAMLSHRGFTAIY